MAKIHINLSQGVFDVEGEPDFVRSVYDDFKTELTKLSVQVKPHRNDDLQLTHIKQDDSVGNVVQGDSEVADSANKKKAKRSVHKPPKGHSCPDRIKVLRAKGFFKSHKTPTEVVVGLAKEGWTHNANQVTAALMPMFNRGDIQRTSAGKGFTYFWDRD